MLNNRNILILAWVAHDPARALYQKPMACVWSRDVERDFDNGMDYAKRNNMMLLMRENTDTVLEDVRREVALNLIAVPR